MDKDPNDDSDRSEKIVLVPEGIVIVNKGSSVVMTPATDLQGKKLPEAMFIHVYLSPRMHDDITRCTAKVFPDELDHKRVIVTPRKLLAALLWINKNYSLSTTAFSESKEMKMARAGYGSDKPSVPIKRKYGG